MANLDHGSDVFFGASGEFVDAETGNNQMGDEMEAAVLSTRTSDGEEGSREQSSNATHRGSTVADVSIYRKKSHHSFDVAQYPADITSSWAVRRFRILMSADSHALRRMSGKESESVS